MSARVFGVDIRSSKSACYNYGKRAYLLVEPKCKQVKTEPSLRSKSGGKRSVLAPQPTREDPRPPIKAS